MPTFITQGRFTREAIKGMVVSPEDRADAVARLLPKAGGRLIGYYLTFGEYDFLVIAEVPGETQMAAVLLAAASERRRDQSQNNAGDDIDRGQGCGCAGGGRSDPRVPFGRRRLAS